MAISYRVLDLRTDRDNPIETLITTARSPEEAARKALTIDVVRSGSRNDLVARVYWQATDQPVTMVRLYRRIANL